MRRVAVLGSTGSIGSNTLDVIAQHPDTLSLVGIATRSRIDELSQQAARFKPSLIAVWNKEKAHDLAVQTSRDDILVGLDGLIEMATHPDVDVVVIATSGRDALIPLVRAIQAGKRIALASKELLVMAGELIMRLVEEHGTSLIPIDSEHAALFQCLHGVDRKNIAQLVVTGSGGPLRTVPADAFATLTQAQVLAHPKWSMGRKITVDSATLMNKGLEIIEARWLFGIPLDRINVVIHPEAIVHGMVELVDGSWLAQMSACDMRLPIQYALSYPERWQADLPRVDMTQVGSMQFHKPDLEKFTCLKLALDAAQLGGSACVVLNGANDIAVESYLAGELPFVEIPQVINETLNKHQQQSSLTLEQTIEIDNWSRQAAKEVIHQCSKL